MHFSDSVHASLVIDSSGYLHDDEDKGDEGEIIFSSNVGNFCDDNLRSVAKLNFYKVKVHFR